MQCGAKWDIMGASGDAQLHIYDYLYITIVIYSEFIVNIFMLSV